LHADCLPHQVRAADLAATREAAAKEQAVAVAEARRVLEAEKEAGFERPRRRLDLTRSGVRRRPIARRLS